MKPIVFGYKLVSGRWSPMISVGLELGGIWQPVEMYVDSGAAYTVLRPNIATGLGFTWRTGRRQFVQVGDGSLIPVYLHRLRMQIGPKQFVTTVGFSDKLGRWFSLAGSSARIRALQNLLSRKAAVRVLSAECLSA